VPVTTQVERGGQGGRQKKQTRETETATERGRERQIKRRKREARYPERKERERERARKRERERENEGGQRGRGGTARGGLGVGRIDPKYCQRRSVWECFTREYIDGCRKRFRVAGR